MVASIVPFATMGGVIVDIASIQAKVGDRVEAGEPPGARGQAFLTNRDGQEAAGTASGSWILHARGATTTTQLTA